MYLSHCPAVAKLLSRWYWLTLAYSIIFLGSLPSQSHHVTHNITSDIIQSDMGPVFHLPFKKIKISRGRNGTFLRRLSRSHLGSSKLGNAAVKEQILEYPLRTFLVSRCIRPSLIYIHIHPTQLKSNIEFDFIHPCRIFPDGFYIHFCAISEATLNLQTLPIHYSVATCRKENGFGSGW